MTRLKDLPIQRKVTLSIVLTCTAALLLACGAFVAYDVANFRRELVENTEGVAGVTGNNTIAALEFNDPAAAADTLASLRSEPNIVAAFVYNHRGTVFASYRRPGTAALAAPARVEGVTHEFTPDRLRLFRPIVIQGEVIGTIVLVSDLTALSQRLSRYAVIVVLVFVVSLLSAILLSRLFERLLTQPILRLAALTRALALDNDYSQRATKESNDEIGQLIDGFNHMLSQLRARDTELHQMHSLLEKRVQSRTAALQLAQEEATREQARFKFIFDTVPVGISLTTQRGDVRVTWLINDAHLRICGLTREQAGEAGIFQRLSHPEDYARQRPLNEKLFAGEISQFTLEKRYLTPAGRTVWVVISVQRRRYSDGTSEDLTTVVDITERKQAEAERETLHRQLVNASRHAGMAEVATGVLHNVGNVLNSVNISAQTMGDRLAGSQLVNLTRAADLIREQGDRFAQFVATDPKGRLLPSFLLNLSTALAEEHAALGLELMQLARNIQHIKEIIFAQQGFAKLAGAIETVAPEELFAEAAGIARASVVQHQIDIDQDYARVPALQVDRHRVLQILINFVTNAIHAVKANPPGRRRITLRLAPLEAGVAFSVSDTGVGIAAEHLNRIFTHGFTTRHDGHGFGLHSGALAARLLGGRVQVRSAGAGLGATFTLELPLAAGATPIAPPPT